MTAIKDYQDLFHHVKKTISEGRVHAIQQVSRTLVSVYWEIGKLIVESQKDHDWGKGTVEQLSKDLQKVFPSKSGLSTRNLWDMRRFYLTYVDFTNLRQLVAEILWTIAYARTTPRTNQ